jgi:hypothetical protein
MCVSARQVHSGRKQHSIRPLDQVPETAVLAKPTGYINKLVKVAAEIQLHPDNVNREDGSNLSKAHH